MNKKTMTQPLLRKRGALQASAVLAACGCASAWAQDHAGTSPLELGTITVTTMRPQVGDIGEDQLASVVTENDMRRFNRDNVGDALDLLSGATVSNLTTHYAWPTASPCSRPSASRA